jgi:Mor family transcriptional regulator
MFLTDMREILAREIKLLSLDPADAERFINKITLTMQRQYAGQPIYISKRTNIELRNTEIYKRFTGMNINQLCRDYNLCAQQVRRIIKSQRQLNQHDIFGH